MNKADFIIPPDPEPGYEDAMTARILSEHASATAMKRARASTAYRRPLLERRGSWLVAAAVFSVAAAVLVWWSGPSVNEGRSAGVDASLVTAATDIKLEDGSTVRSQSGARLEILTQSPALVRVRLLRGAATFDVVPNRDRLFLVLTPDVEVTVLGTRFTVTVEEEQADPVTAVKVDHGRVAVTDRQDSSIQELAAGQVWARSPRVDAVPSGAAGVAPAAPSNSSRDATEDSANAAPTPARRPSAALLLADANAARTEGNVAKAIARYETLVRLYPKHPSASVAALELGRLRMRQGNPTGAVTALEQSLSADPLSPVREHSLANLVEAQERSGNLEECHAARARYLEEFPSGARASEVHRRCR
jgi:TolA-binding protein